MKQAIQLGTLSLANIGVGFLFQWYVLTQLGPGMETDALFAGMTLPQMVLAVISGSLMHVLVPLLAGEDQNHLRHDAWGFLVLVGGLFGLLSTILYVAAPWWIPITVPGFSDAGLALTVNLTRIQLIGMVFAAINGVQWAAYHARQQFVWAEFTPLLTSAFSLLLLIWALPKYGVVAAAWISSLRMGLQTLLLAPGMGRPVFPDLRSPTISVAWQRTKPLLLGTAYYKTDPLIDRFLLSTTTSGSLSLYYLVQQIYSAVNQIINKSIMVPLVPMLAKYHKSRNMACFWKLYNRKIFQIAIVGLTGVIVLLFWGKPLLGLLIGYGNIRKKDVNSLWLLMFLMSGQFVIGNLGVVIVSMFYSLGNTRSPTVSGSVAYTLGLPLRIIMFNMLGVNGLAASVSVYYLISFFIIRTQVKKVKYETDSIASA